MDLRSGRASTPLFTVTAPGDSAPAQSSVGKPTCLKAVARGFARWRRQRLEVPDDVQGHLRLVHLLEQAQVVGRDGGFLLAARKG